MRIKDSSNKKIYDTVAVWNITESHNIISENLERKLIIIYNNIG